MQRILPTLADASIVRTYPENYAGTDSESEEEAQFEGDAEDTVHCPILTRLHQNRQYMDNQITPVNGQPSAWVLEPQNWPTSQGTNVVLVRKPTASNLSHRLLNPFIYRNIGNVGSLDALATLLGTPTDWEVTYDRIVNDNRIPNQLRLFSDFPDDTSEADIQFEFTSLVAVIAYQLGLVCRTSSETKIIVGGILARHEYDVRSKSDPHILNTDGVNLIATEVKTRRTFGPGDMWYHSSRGIQVLSALYAFNCPTFLFTQGQWKLFVENDARNSILTFPYGNDSDHSPHVNSSLVQSMGTTFLKAIVVCLLSKRTYRKKQPSFVSGFIDGIPLYTTVRVLSEEDVLIIEDKITLQEKAEFNLWYRAS